MSETKENRDIEFCNVAKHISKYSTDKSTKVGAILSDDLGECLGVGWNSWATAQCSGIIDRELRPLKYKWMIHAEIEAIGNAARSGRSTFNSTLHLPFDAVPCTECCKALIAAGVSRIVCLGGNKFEGKGEHWAEDLVIAREMLEEVGIIIEVVYPIVE